MPQTEPPGGRPVVASLLDRMPRRERARRLVALALGEHLKDESDIAHYASMAERLDALDPDAALARLEAEPPDWEDVRAAKITWRAARAARSFLRNEADAAFAEWAAVIAEYPDHAAPVFVMRSVFLMLCEELEAALADADHAVALAPTDSEAYRQRADVFEAMNRHAEASANYLRAVQLSPHSVRALRGAGLCLAVQHEWAQALPWYARAIKLAPRGVHLRVERAFCFESLGQLDKALADLDAAIAVDPMSAESFHARGRCLAASKRPAEALAAFTRSIELDPANTQVWSARAWAHLARELVDEAMADAVRALTLDAANPQARLAQALIHRIRGEVALSLAAYEDTTRIAPTDVSAIVMSAMAHAKAGDMSGLRRAYDAFVAAVPTSAAVRSARAELLYDEGGFEAALEDLDMAITFMARYPDPEDPAATTRLAGLHHRRADALRSLDRHEEAARAEERAVELAPEVGLYRSWLGFTRMKIEAEVGLAEADLDRGIELSPDEPVLRLQRALFYEEMERWAEAIADLEALMVVSPETWLFYFHRGTCRWQSSDDPLELGGVLPDYDRALELGGPNAEVLVWRALAHEFFGHPEAAFADFDQAITLEPDGGEAYCHRARLRRAAGDEDGARADAARATELGWDPEEEDSGAADGNGADEAS